MGAQTLLLVGIGCCTALMGVGAVQTGFAAQTPEPPKVTQIDPEQLAEVGPAQSPSLRRPARGLAGLAAVAAAAASPGATDALSGVVKGTNGAVVPGYLVEAFTSDGNFIADTTTDAAGRYAFPTLQAGPYKVRVSGPSQGAALWAMGWAGGSTSMAKARVLVVGPSAQTVDVTLPRAATVTGIVSAVPVGSEVRVCAGSFLDCRFTLTNASGRFTIAGLAAGLDSIVVHPVGGVDLAFPKDPPRYGVTLRAGQTTTVALDARTQGDPVVTIAGKVIRPPGPRPLRDRTAPTVTKAKITAEGPKRYVTVSATDNQGGSGLRNVQVRVGDAQMAPTPYSQTPLAAPGTSPVAVRVQDEAGNYSTWQVAK